MKITKDNRENFEILYQSSQDLIKILNNYSEEFKKLMMVIKNYGEIFKSIKESLDETKN